MLAIGLGLLLLTASSMKLWSETRYPQPSHPSWIESPAVSDLAAMCGAAIGFILLAGLIQIRGHSPNIEDEKC
jgi:hypothetical protein